LQGAAEFFGETTEGLAKVIETALHEQDAPSARSVGVDPRADASVGWMRYREETSLNPP
jgi:hypothetical protein